MFYGFLVGSVYNITIYSVALNLNSSKFIKFEDMLRTKKNPLEN